MKFVTFNSKSIIAIIATLFIISLTFISSSEIKSMIKTNTLIKNSSNSLLKIKANSKLSLMKKKFSLEAPPGADLNLSPQISQPTNPSPAPVGAPAPAPVPAPADPAVPAAPVLNPSVTSPPAGAQAVTKINATKGNGDVIFNDWLQISSKSFHLQYNEIDMGFHGANVKIKTNSNDFRINDAFARDINTDNQPPSAELFWFRLTNDLIFYSSTKQDLNLLGGIKISDINSADGDKKGIDGEFCFEIVSKQGNTPWEICTHIKNVRDMWFCKIQELRKETQPLYCTNANGDSTTKIIIKNVIFKN